MEKKQTIHTIKILLVEDHPIFRKGLMEVINNEKDFSVCGESEDTVTALRMAKDLEPDLAIVDLSLQDRNGLELIKDIKNQNPSIMILVLSMHDEKLYAERALRSGAKGYIMKQEAPETIIKAIRHILNGNIFVSDVIATRMLNKMLDGKSGSDGSPVDILSNRELEVFQLLGEGFSTRNIASKLNVSIKTIENHRAHIKEKLNLNTSIELVQQATLWVKGNPIK